MQMFNNSEYIKQHNYFINLFIFINGKNIFLLVLQILESDDKYNDDLIFFFLSINGKTKGKFKTNFCFHDFSKLTIFNSYNMISIGA